tara:strand:- start:25 stop:366 length:342 start_codon:yes stop_codon:yes gene_type:complete
VVFYSITHWLQNNILINTFGQLLCRAVIIILKSIVFFMQKRVNFNMAIECHALLKQLCAYKRVTVSAYIYDVIAKDFAEMVKNDPIVKEMLLASDYPESSRAHALKVKIMTEA